MSNGSVKNDRFPMLALAEIARPISRPVDVVRGQSYRTIGVQWWGEGAYERETIDGSQTAAKTLSLVREGDLIITKIWVRHGSTAIASAAVDSCAASAASSSPCASAISPDRRRVGSSVQRGAVPLRSRWARHRDLPRPPTQHMVRRTGESARSQRAARSSWHSERAGRRRGRPGGAL